MLNACVLLPVVAFTCDAVNGLAVRELAHSHKAKLTEQLFCLRCLSGDFEGREFGVDSQGFIIGRNPSFANVVLSDDEVSGKLKLSFSVQINPVAPAFLASFSISAMSAGE